MPSARLPRNRSRSYKTKYKPESLLLLFDEFLHGPPRGEEHPMFCPVHESPDTSNSPSASLNPSKGSYYCFTGDHGGSIDSLVADMVDREGWDTRQRIMQARGRNPAHDIRPAAKGSTGLPNSQRVAAWTAALLSSPIQLRAFKAKRGLSNETIADYELGWDASSNRYTIPVFDAEGRLLNVRRYRMNAEAADKMRSIPGHGTSVLFLPDVLVAHDKVVLTEGELDAILLNQEGVPAVSATGGAGRWNPAWNASFTGKHVYICYDADDTGRVGARKVLGNLRGVASAVYLMELPATEGVHGYDITDYLVGENHTFAEFRGLMDAAVEERLSAVDSDETVSVAGQSVSLAASLNVTDHDLPLEILTTVAGKTDEPYSAPKQIRVTCDMSKGKVCDLCPVGLAGGDFTKDVSADDHAIMRFIDAPEGARNKAMKDVSGARCSDRSEFTVAERWHVHNLLVQPSVDDQADISTPVRRTLLSVTDENQSVRTNEKVRFVGKNASDAKTGQLRFLSWHKEPVEMDIDAFVLNADRRRWLEAFQPAPGQTALDKAKAIAADMAENVTQIVDRDMLHVGYDLVWHSPLSFYEGEQLVEKGWLEMMVVGDTRTGKSEIAARLVEHYHSGRLVSCEGMSFAGLVGGLQQFGQNRFETTWGVVPMNDRRLVVLDEVSGLADKAVVEKMSSVRSSGIAQIVKIRTDETQARTRLIWITNPADGRMIHDQPLKGISAMASVVPNAEDQARFDFVMATAKGDVSAERINQNTSEHVNDPGYSSEACETLIKWIWSLKARDVQLLPEAGDAARKAAVTLGKRFLPEPPLIQAENARYKIMRLAAALAARTFSCDPKTSKLVVTAAHVAGAVQFLEEIYEEPAMNYAAVSDRAARDIATAEQSYPEAMDYFRDNPAVAVAFEHLSENTFTQADLRGMSGLEGQQALNILAMFTRWRLLTLRGRVYRMSPLLLKALQESEIAAAGE